MSLMKIAQIDPGQARSLVDQLDVYQAALYPAQSNHLDSLDTLCRENVKMFGAKERGQLIAMGAVKIYRDYGEIKRVFVPPAHRNKGLAKKIMAALERCLVQQSIRFSKLETGIYQKEAIALYQKLGYQQSLAFGPYTPDFFSVFMVKKLLPVPEMQPVHSFDI